MLISVGVKVSGQTEVACIYPNKLVIGNYCAQRDTAYSLK